MTTRAADDFASIAARMREIRGEPEPACSTCDGCGWIAYATGHHDPHFKECETCGNPDKRQSP